MIEDDQNSKHFAHELDLKQIVLDLWAGKIYIFVMVLICIFLAVLHLNIAPRKYEVTYSLAPVISDNKHTKLPNLGGLASFAGIDLGSNRSSEFLTYKFLLNSEEVAETLLQNKDLTRAIFDKEWSIPESKFKAPDRGLLIVLINAIKKLLTGNDSSDYVAPNPTRLADWIEKNLEITEDKTTGFLNLRSETSNPSLMTNLMTLSSQITDNLIRKRHIDRTQQIIHFYNEKLSNARAREHREALATLLAQEDQKLIFALRGKYFVAEPISVPSVSLYPTSPKPKIVLALSLLLGGFLGSTFVIARKALSK